MTALPRAGQPSPYLCKPLRTEADTWTDCLRVSLDAAEKQAERLRDCLPPMTDAHDSATEMLDHIQEAIRSLASVERRREEDDI